MPTRIFLQPFTCHDRDSYREYRGIKHRVFAVEQGWPSSGDFCDPSIAQEDTYDPKGRFVLARDETGAPIGIVRGIPLKEGFPHSDLFAHHFRRPELYLVRDWLCTVNALAVLPAYRRRQCEVVDRGWRGGVGTLLVLLLCRLMEDEGLKGVVATAEGLVSALFFRDLGFVVIDRPIRTALHPTFSMTNIGMVFGSSAHRTCQARCGLSAESQPTADKDVRELITYFERREAEILLGGDLPNLFPPETEGA
jgi:hypothetical protein